MKDSVRAHVLNANFFTFMIDGSQAAKRRLTDEGGTVLHVKMEYLL